MATNLDEIKLRMSRHFTMDDAGADLLSFAKKFKKFEADWRASLTVPLHKKKVAVLGNYTTALFAPVLRLALLQEGIDPELKEFEYDSFRQEIMGGDSGLYAFAPDVVLLLLDHRDVRDLPPLLSGREEVRDAVARCAQGYEALWKAIARKCDALVIQANFVVPFERSLGNLEGASLFSRNRFLQELNHELAERRAANVQIFDMEYLAQKFGKRHWFDEVSFFLNKQAFSMDAFGIVAFRISQLVALTTGRVKKCLVLDLDNTLWGGVIGDDGMGGIKIGGHDGVGEAFHAFQRYVRRLKERGVILAVCSKNEDNIAREPFEAHADMHLRLDDIACFVANWENKADNLRKIAAALNIGLDSLVFFDDNPAEREIVKRFAPEVQVIEVPEDPAHYVRVLELANPFELLQFNAEDASRVDTYVADRKRMDMAEAAVDYPTYLRSLDMKATAARITSAEVQRFTQLINKSNQFNLRTARYTEGEVARMMEDRERYACVFVRLADKFSDYGIISCLILRREGKGAFIDTWVMSCRVLKRGVEELAFNALLEYSKQWGVDRIDGEYLPTAKNAMVSGLLDGFGFTKIDKRYSLHLAQAKPREHFIQVEGDI